MRRESGARRGAVLYVPDVDRVRSWRPAVAGVSEVLFAHFTDHPFPALVHDHWTVLLVASGVGSRFAPPLSTPALPVIVDVGRVGVVGAVRVQDLRVASNSGRRDRRGDEIGLLIHHRARLDPVGAGQDLRVGCFLLWVAYVEYSRRQSSAGSPRGDLTQRRRDGRSPRSRRPRPRPPGAAPPVVVRDRARPAPRRPPPGGSRPRSGRRSPSGRR